MAYPKSVNILGKEYKIEYVDSPSDVDLYKRQALWGQIDYWTRSIRVYRNNRSFSDIMETVFHEVIHGISEGLNIKVLKGDEHEDSVSLLAVALADTFIRNGWLGIKN